MNIICSTSIGAPPELLDGEEKKKEWEPCVQNTAHCASEKLKEFFSGTGPLTACCFCRLPVTRADLPQAKAPTKILRRADGLKTWLLPLPHMARLSCDEPGTPHTHSCAQDTNINTEICQHPVTQSVQVTAERWHK